MKRIILSISLYVLISSIISLREPLKETHIKTFSYKSADEIINNLIKPSLPVSYEANN